MKTIITISIAIALSMYQATAQPFNVEILENGTSTLQGKINKEGLTQAPFSDWFTENYTNYTPDNQTVDALKTALNGITIKGFMGTWCGDSKKEVPKFYKVLDEAGFPLERLTMVGVSRERDHYKQSPGGEEEGIHIARVPSFIFYKDGKEINRFVERPISTLENDVLQLLEGEYDSAYCIIAKVGEELDNLTPKIFQKRIKKIARKMRPYSENYHELNTFSNVLFYAEKIENAILIAQLNTLLFPKEANTFVSLGNKLVQANKVSEAKKAYEKACDMDPKNERATQALALLNNEGES